MSFSLNLVSRRTALRTAVLGSAGLATSGLNSSRAASAQLQQYPPLKGRINHSVARWTFKELSLDDLCLAVKQIGFSAIGLLRPHEWLTLKAHGVDCSMCLAPGPSAISDSFANVSAHDELVDRYLKAIDLVADAGYRNLLCFSGNRRGQTWEEGLTSAETGLKRVLGHAEKRGVVLAMVMWSSKQHSPDYMCDSTAWAVSLCKRLGAPNFGLIYDLYHMQIMEGNIRETIRKYHEYFVYYHTGGIPDRCEIGDNQELNYPTICRAVVETGYKGYFSQEYVPTISNKIKDNLIASLREAIHICDV